MGILQGAQETVQMIVAQSFPATSTRPLNLEVAGSGGRRVSSAQQGISFESTPSIETTRLTGEYALPLASPDLVGDRPEAAPITFVPATHGSFRLGALGEESTVAESWWNTRAGTIAQLVIMLVFVAAESSKQLLSVAALNGKGLVPVQNFIVAQGVVSLLVAVLFTGGLDGTAGMRAAFAPREILGCLPVSVGFSLSQSALALSFSGGLGAANVMVLGLLYMPLCAFLSRWVFHRHYGWLEVHALGFLTLASMIFTELRCRAEGIPHSSNAVEWCLASTVFSCFSSLFAERVLKAKYTPWMPQKSFYVQKVWLEAGGLLVGTVALLICARIEGWPTWVSWWSEWDIWMGVALVTRVAQSWMAGLLAKHLSTVARAVIQCVALLVVYVYVAVEHPEIDANLTESTVAVIVALSAVMYQIGRRMTEQEKETQKRQDDGTASPQALLPAMVRSISDPTWNRSPATEPPASNHGVTFNFVKLTFSDSESAMLPEAHALAPREFRMADAVGAQPEPAQQTDTDRNWLFDSAWLGQVGTVNTSLAQWIASRKGYVSQVLCVVAFILADSSRTLIYVSVINNSPIVTQSLVAAQSAASIPIGNALSAFIDGQEGLLASLSLMDALICLPVAACFSLGQTLQLKAYSAGISASVNTVLGYFYMPLSALLSRWVFRRAYGGLEWLALTLLSLAAVVFVLLRNDRTQSPTSMEAIICCFGSVISSCLGSLFCEKIMKSRTSPFYTQKVHLEMGGLLTATAMLVIVGLVSDRDKDAFWKPRDVDGVQKSGLFVGWDWSTILALVVTLLQSWLGGLVSKRLSTVVRSVAQCMSLLIIYFYGDLVLKGLQFDWVVGAAAVVVALSVQVFTLAGLRARESTKSEPMEGLPEAEEAAECERPEPPLPQLPRQQSA